MAKIRVLIADDEPTVRAALSELIEDEESLELVGLAEDADRAIDLAQRFRPDVALVDVRMPFGGGPRAARVIRETLPRTRVLALSAYHDRGSVFQMLQSGAVGYIVKGSSVEEILSSIHNVARGGASLSTAVASHVVHELARDLERQEREAEEHRRRVQQIQQFVSGNDLSMVYQPIANLETGEIVGVEALARFATQPPHSPDHWFTEAAAVGLPVELEMAAVRAACEGAERLALGLFLSINVSPETATTTALAEELTARRGTPLVLEITEHLAIDDYAGMRNAFEALRAAGIRIAVDDAGAGFASLRHILHLAPDLIKLDITLVRNIHGDQARRALAAALITFANEIGATIVAEGIESSDELQTLLTLGVRYGQGFYIAEPGPLPLKSLRVEAFGVQPSEGQQSGDSRRTSQHSDVDPTRDESG